MTRTMLFVACGWLAFASAQAQILDKYGITAQEQADCRADAAALCAFAYPDEDRLILCMRENRDSLSARCLKTFTAGFARRHL